MNTPWIKASGSVPATYAEFSNLLAQHTPADAAYYMANNVAEFRAGSVQPIQGGGAPECTPVLPSLDTLLELRIFGANAELWLHRTTLDAPFAWRVADDATLCEHAAAQANPFLQNPNHYRLPQVQYCSIDKHRTATPPALDAHGRQVLYALGGRQYALPAPEGCDCVTLVSYLSYEDTTAQALPLDFRFCGFGTETDAPKPL